MSCLSWLLGLFQTESESPRDEFGSVGPEPGVLVDGVGLLVLCCCKFLVAFSIFWAAILRASADEVSGRPFM